MGVGDFNQILHSLEKKGVRDHNGYEIMCFRKFLDDCCVVDAPIKGCTFIWCNNRVEVWVKERIDRMFHNNKSLSIFPYAYVIALPPVDSDHSLGEVWSCKENEVYM